MVRPVQALHKGTALPNVRECGYAGRKVANLMHIYLLALALALFTLYQGVRAVDRALHPEAWADRAAPAISRVHQF